MLFVFEGSGTATTTSTTSTSQAITVQIQRTDQGTRFVVPSGKLTKFDTGQGGHWSGKSQRNLIFLQGPGKVREFCKFVRKILNT